MLPRANFLCHLGTSQDKQRNSDWLGRAGLDMVLDHPSPITPEKRAGFVPRSRKRGLFSIIFLCLCWLFAVAMPAWPQGIYTFTTFDAPGAGTTALQGTIPININAAGDVTGIYLEASSFPLAHGFVRAANGTIVTFDATHAGTAPGEGTFPSGINTAGVVTGTYIDTNKALHGFVRQTTGTITEFDAPGAATAVNMRGTVAFSINAAGVVTGRYSAANGVYHGFIRAADGTITTFDIPGAGTLIAEGTVAFGINSAGVITGLYADADYTYHGFVRAANGRITTFDAPGAATGFKAGTVGVSINTVGDIAGVYSDTVFPPHSRITLGHAFVRAANGKITTFDPPGTSVGTGSLQGAFALSINAAGVVTGTYTDSSGVIHGFVRASNGTITAPINAPDAGTFGVFPGTACTSINDWGVITGAYTDDEGVIHGYVATPSVTFQSTLDDIRSSQNEGLIKNEGVATALTVQINAAFAAARRGDYNAARNNLTAFIELVNSQTGSQIDEAAAEVLLADANALLSVL